MSVYGVLVVGITPTGHESWLGRFCPHVEKYGNIDTFQSAAAAAFAMRNYYPGYIYRVVSITPFICKRVRKDWTAKFPELLQ